MAEQDVDIYTDSAYAHVVCHIFGAVWKTQGFQKTGSEIQHKGQILELIIAMLKPSRLAIVKCQAHRKGNNFVIVGNNKADEMPRQASGSKTAQIAPAVTLHSQPSLDDIKEMQREAPNEEKTEWERRGAKQGEDELWRSAEGMLIAPLPLLTLLISEEHRHDHCARAQVMRNLKRQGFWSPYLQNCVDYQLSLCEIFAKNNIRKPLTAPIGHIPVPEGPIKHLMMDYVDMLHKVKGKRYMLVIIDRFSQWVEAIPSKDKGAGTVVKFLVNLVIPRFGIPVMISSDNGPAFVGHVVRQVMQTLWIKQRYGCVYHPQSQGVVERVNGILKAKINKICQDAHLNWVDALPLALMCYRRVGLLTSAHMKC